MAPARASASGGHGRGRHGGGGVPMRPWRDASLSPAVMGQDTWNPWCSVEWCSDACDPHVLHGVHLSLSPREHAQINDRLNVITSSKIYFIKNVYLNKWKELERKIFYTFLCLVSV